MKKQGDSHDWLGDCAESYVAYLLSRARFEVFAGTKWGADLAIRRAKLWLRVEIKSTDTNKSFKSIKKYLQKQRQAQLKKAEILAIVRLKKDLLEVTFYKLRSGRITKQHSYSTPPKLSEFILQDRAVKFLGRQNIKNYGR